MTPPHSIEAIPPHSSEGHTQIALKCYFQSTHVVTSSEKNRREFRADRLRPRFHPGSKSRSADEALAKAGCKKIFDDKISGSHAERPGLAKLQEALRDGDTLVVWKLDRLGRSVKHLVGLVGELHKRGVQFKSLTDAIDTGTASGRFFFHVMASLAEMERELIIEPTQAGLKVARQLGRTGGRKRQMTESKIESAKKLLASGVPPRDVAANPGVSVPTLYRWIPASSHP